MKNDKKYEGGFFGSLTIVFILLKLFGFVEWSWLWVFSPIWLPIVFVLILIVVYLIVIPISNFFKEI